MWQKMAQVGGGTPDWNAKGVTHITGPDKTVIEIDTNLTNITEFYAIFKSDDSVLNVVDVFGYTNGYYWFAGSPRNNGGMNINPWGSASTSQDIRPNGITNGVFKIITSTSGTAAHWTGTITWFAK